MSSENTKSSLGFVEILAILLFIVGVVFIFISGNGKEDQERETRNALRFQHVSEIADNLWKLSISSTEYSTLISLYETDIACSESSLTVRDFETLLVPDYFETIPVDPNGQDYKVSFSGQEKRITVCSPWGEETDGTNRLISITR